MAEGGVAQTRVRMNCLEIVGEDDEPTQCGFGVWYPKTLDESGSLQGRSEIVTHMVLEHGYDNPGDALEAFKAHRAAIEAEAQMEVPTEEALEAFRTLLEEAEGAGIVVETTDGEATVAVPQDSPAPGAVYPGQTYPGQIMATGAEAHRMMIIEWASVPDDVANYAAQLVKWVLTQRLPQHLLPQGVVTLDSEAADTTSKFLHRTFEEAESDMDVTPYVNAIKGALASSGLPTLSKARIVKILETLQETGWSAP